MKGVRLSTLTNLTHTSYLATYGPIEYRYLYLFYCSSISRITIVVFLVGVMLVVFTIIFYYYYYCFPFSTPSLPSPRPRVDGTTARMPTSIAARSITIPPPAIACLVPFAFLALASCTLLFWLLLWLLLFAPGLFLHL